MPVTCSRRLPHEAPLVEEWSRSSPLFRPTTTRTTQPSCGGDGAFAGARAAARWNAVLGLAALVLSMPRHESRRGLRARHRQHRRPVDRARRQRPESLVASLERKDIHRGADRNGGGQLHELGGVAAGDVGHTAKLALPP